MPSPPPPLQLLLRLPLPKETVWWIRYPSPSIFDQVEPQDESDGDQHGKGDSVPTLQIPAEAVEY